MTTRADESRRGPLVEVTHESLFKAWPALDQWLTEEQAFLTDLERIRAAHENWSTAPDEQKSGELLYGLLLSRARDWLIRYPQRFIGREMEPLRAFIAESAQVADAAKAREAARAAEEKRKPRNFRIVASMAGAMLPSAVLAGLAAIAANDVRKLAGEERNQAPITQSPFLADKADDVSQLGDYGRQWRWHRGPAGSEARHQTTYVAKAELMFIAPSWRCASKKRSRWRRNCQTAWCAAEVRRRTATYDRLLATNPLVRCRHRSRDKA